MALLGHVSAEMTLRYASLASPTIRAAYDQAITDATRDQTGYSEFLDTLLQAETDYRQERKTGYRIKSARFTLRPAFEDIDFTASRSISKAQIKELYSLQWLNEGRPVLLVGQTGVGKTFLAQAIGLHACACGRSVLYMTVTTWLENVALARSSGTYLRYRDKVAKPDVLILDDMGMRKLSSTEAQDLCEILEERSIGKSTVKWGADFTYLWTHEGWLFVASVIDLFSRRVVGWSTSARMTAELVIDALMTAIWRRGSPRSVLHHSDQGGQGGVNRSSQQFVLVMILPSLRSNF